MSLSLRGNPIETIGTRSFHRLKYLTKLDLSECHISNVDPGAFEGLESLQRIYLHNNHLTTISGRDIPPSLHGLSVHDNRSIYWLPCACGSIKLGVSITTLSKVRNNLSFILPMILIIWLTMSCHNLINLTPIKYKVSYNRNKQWMHCREWIYTGKKWYKWENINDCCKGLVYLYDRMPKLNAA